MASGPTQGSPYGVPPPQSGYSYPPQSYPPQQGPPQHFQGGPPQQFQQGPPQPFQQGPPPQFQQAPQQQWGAPSGQFPPHQIGGPAPPSLGYDPRAAAQGDASRDADALRSAMKGLGTDERALIAILSKPDPLQMALLRNTFKQRHNRVLEQDIKSETSSSLEDGLVALVQGPLMQDVHGIRNAIRGLGTNESLLSDVLIGKSNADMHAIKQAYYEYTEFKTTMESDVAGDLSLNTKKLFNMLMAATKAEESTPAIPQALEKDVADLHAATIGRAVGADQITVCGILTSRSDGQIRAIAQQFEQRYHQSLEKVIQKKFKDHMEDALVLLVHRATDRAMSDAVQLEEAIKGGGTRKTLLANRVVSIHWNRQHMDQVKRAYQHRFKNDLIGRVKSEIRDKTYQALLVACLT